VTQLMAATGVPHKTRQPGMQTIEKKRDAPRFCQDASPKCQIELKSAKPG